MHFIEELVFDYGDPEEEVDFTSDSPHIVAKEIVLDYGEIEREWTEK